MDFAKWSYQLSTAGFLRGGNCIRDMPSIQIEKASCYPYDEIVTTAKHCTTHRNFRSDFPQIIQNQHPEWILWQVDIRVDQLVLRYLHRGDFASGTRKLRNANQNSAIVVVNSPIALGVCFDVPAIGREPRIFCECVMCCSGRGGTHNVTISERRGDETNPTVLSLTRPPAHS